MFGLDDQLGTLQSGHLASFVVITNGDLFEKKTKVVETWISGESLYEHSPEKARSTAGFYRVVSSDASSLRR
ncbi:MAG: hypothetical protein U0936_10975 [Planctomycetaceae bacterium]